MSTVYANRFAGRAAVITGGASGLGKAVAARIVAEGGQVALWDLDAENLKAVAADIGAAHTVALDVSDEAAVLAAARDAGVRAAHKGARRARRRRPVRRHRDGAAAAERV